MRLFIAIDLAHPQYFDDLRKQVSSDTARLTLTKSAHLTLNFIGEADPEKVHKTIKEIAIHSFTLTTDAVDFFAPHHLRVVFISFKHSRLLSRLQQKLQEAVPSEKKKEFHPHITLARIRAVKNKKSYIQQLTRLTPPTKKFPIKEFHLIQSTLTTEGPVYKILHTYALK